MRIESRIAFHMSPTEVEQIFKLLGLQTDFSGTLQVVNLFTDSIEYITLIRHLKELAVDYFEVQTNIFSEDELQNAIFLDMLPAAYCGYPEPAGEGTYVAVSYDINSGCPKCSKGKNQINPFRILKPKMGRNDISAIYWVEEFVITSRLRSLFENADIRGIEYWPILNARGNKVWDNVFQMKVLETLSPMSPEAMIPSTVPPCCCGYEGYQIKDIPVFDSTVIEQIGDIGKTQEWSGAGYHTRPHIIVSKKFFQLFRKNNIKGVKFQPVRVKNM